MKDTAKRWSRVRGPIGATVVTLLGAGWRPAAATAWMHPTGEQYLRITGARIPDKTIRRILERAEGAVHAVQERVGRAPTPAPPLGPKVDDVKPSAR